MPIGTASLGRSEKPTDQDIRDMARGWYGYGRWDAPYWFVGPEPGMGSDENNDLGPRCAAWMKLGACELVDCKDHHLGFGLDKWHRQHPTPPTQPTWRQLIRLLLAYRNEGPPDIEDIRAYQQRCWGMKDGETCVIELCSLAANNLGVDKNVDFDPDSFRAQRIDVIRKRIHNCSPKFVVMYGVKSKPYWEAIAGVEFAGHPEICLINNGRTQGIFTIHPVGFGTRKTYWVNLAERLRRTRQN